MARVLVTGSADGLGQLSARKLAEEGHEVFLHARDPARAHRALEAVPGARGALVADLASLAETRALAAQAKDAGPFDAVIHNAAVGYREPRRLTPDGVEHVFAVNVLAPYVLTALMPRPRRLVFLSSGMHRGGDPGVEDLAWRQRTWDGAQAYADSKLHDLVLAMAVARRWPCVLSNAVEPGWVPTKMGGPSAPDDLALGAETQAWLAVSEEPRALVTGGYFYHRAPRPSHPAAALPEVQERLLAACEALSGVPFPDGAAPGRPAIHEK